MDDKILYTLIALFSAILGFFGRESFTRYFNKKERVREHRLKLLEEIYTDVGIAMQIRLIEDEEKEVLSLKAIGRLGFSLRVYFPNLFNNEYKSLMEKVMLLKANILVERIKGEFSQEFISTYQSELKVITNNSSIIYESIINEAVNYK